jgi:hypothetical protein
MLLVMKTNRKLKQGEMKTTVNRFVFIVGILVITSITVFAQYPSNIPAKLKIAESLASGNWNDPAIWSNNKLPGDSTFIIIHSGHTVHLVANSSCESLVIEQGATLDNGIYNLTVVFQGEAHGISAIDVDDGVTYYGYAPINETWTITNPNNGNWNLYKVDGLHTGTGNTIFSCNDFYDPNDLGFTITGSGTVSTGPIHYINTRVYGAKFNSACTLEIFSDLNLIDINYPTFGGGSTIGYNFGSINLKGNAGFIASAGEGSFNNMPGGEIILENGDFYLAPEAAYVSYIMNDGTIHLLEGDIHIPSDSFIFNNSEIIVNGNILGIDDTNVFCFFVQNAEGAVLSITGEIFPPDYTGSLTCTGYASGPNYVIYNGSAQQTVVQPVEIYQPETPNPYSILVIDNSAGVILNEDILLHDTLIITNGQVNLADNNLTLGDTAAISGIPSSTAMIVATGTGEVRKKFASVGSFTFPVGDNNSTAEYSPVTLDFTTGTFADGFVGINIANSPYPGASGSYLNRYWNVTAAGITDFTCNAQFDYVPADVTGTENNLFCYRVAPTVDQYNATNTALHQLTANGLISFGTFTGGEPYSPEFPMAYTVTGGGSYCEGSEGREVGLSGSELTVTYTLFKNDVAQSPTIAGTGSAISFGNQFSGTYTVTGTNDSGTTLMTGNAVIIENALVTPVVTIASNTNSGCAGTYISIIATTVNGGDTPVYQWFVNGIESGDNTPDFTYVPENEDMISLILTSSELCTNENPVESNTLSLFVNALPEVSWTTFIPDTLCENWTPVALTGGIPEGGDYSGNGVVNNIFYPSVAGFGNHLITYRYLNENGCAGEASRWLFVDVCEGVKNLNSDFVIFPNPASDVLNIMFHNNQVIESLVLINMSGAVVYTQISEKGESQIRLTSKQFLPGNYILRITTKTEVLYKSVVLF